MIRLILVVVFVFLFLVIGCIPAFVLWLIGKKDPGLKDRAAKHIVSGAFRVVLFLAGVRVTAEGTEKIPTDRPVLYVGNHRGFFDIVVSYTLFPGVTGYVAKKEMLKVPLLSLWMRYIHCLFLDRSNIKEGLKTILQGIDEVKHGISMCIYPEGTRSRGASETDMLEFKEGSLKIAEKSGCPVIPVAMVGTADVLENHFPWIKATRVKIRFGDPIDLKSLSKEDRRFAGAHVRDVILDMITDMKKEG